jgi:hypothetical protein
MGALKLFVAVFLLGMSAALSAEEDVLTPVPPAVEDGETLDEEPGAPPAVPFSGDVRVRLRRMTPRSHALQQAPSELRHSPYVSQRTRLRWGDRLQTGWLVTRPSPGPSLAWAEVRRGGTAKGYLQLSDFFLLGHYSLSFGQGLIFYDHPAEFARAVLTRARGPAPDLSSGMDDHMRGGVLQAAVGGWEAAVFLSRQALNAPLTPEGTADTDLWSLREAPGGPESLSDLAAMDSLREDLSGVHLGFKVEGRGSFGLTAARARYSPSIQPVDSSFGDAHSFRGVRNDLLGADASWHWGDSSFQCEASRSRPSQGDGGSAWAGTLLKGEKRAGAWMGFFSYDRDYFARQGKGPSFEGPPQNQRGLFAGFHRETSGGTIEGETSWARFPGAQGDGSNSAPLSASAARRWRLDGIFSPFRKWELRGRFQERVRDRRQSFPGDSDRLQGPETIRRARLESQWQASSQWRLRWRQDVRWERRPLSGERAEGRSLMVEGRWSPSDRCSWTVRQYVFDSPDAYLTSGVEEIWNGVASDSLAGGMGSFRGASGERWAFIFRRKWGESIKVWAKYDTNRRWKGADAGDSRHGWHLQTDWTF